MITTASTGGDQSAALEAWAHVGKRQMEYAMESACALFKGVEAMGEIQLQTAHATRTEHEHAEQKLHAAHDASEIAAVQNDLLRFDTQGAARYWQELVEVMFKTQAEMIGCMRAWVESSEADELKSALKPLQDTMLSALPLDSWFKSPVYDEQASAGGPDARAPAHAPRKRARATTTRARA